MAYRRPAIEVIQEFQEAAAALALPSLPACIVGPGYQIRDDVNVGVYSEDDLSVASYPYSGLAVGAIVDLTDTPEDEDTANAHKSVGVKLTDVLLVKEPALPETQRITGKLVTPNVFQDVSVGAFSSFDPDADNAPTFYIDVISGVGLDPADVGRKLIIDKNSDNELVVAAEWQSVLPLSNVVYRVLEFRDEEIYAESTFGSAGISKDADSVDINPGLKSVTDAVPMTVVEGTVLLSWRALRPDLAGTLTAFTDLDSLEAVFGVGAVVPANTGAYAVNLALLNTTTEVNFVGLGAALFTNEENAYQDALEFLENKDVYAIAVLTQNTAIHQTLKTHVEGMSVSTVGRERVGLLNRKLTTLEVVVPASGLGTETTAGTGNGISGVDNTDFKDPASGSFITDDVGVGHYLEISAYAAVPGVHRSLTPNERDYFRTGPDQIQLINGNFSGTDVGKQIILRGSLTPGNDIVFTISATPSAVKATVTPTPTAELMASTTRAWITTTQRSIAHNAADAVVAATNTWSFINGAFTAADVGRLLFVANAANAGNNGAFTIVEILSATSIKTVEAPAADETFGGGVTQDVYTIVREPARDTSSDSVDGPSREWTILNGAFTSSDVGRRLAVAGAVNGANNSLLHVIEAVISPTVVRTDNTTTPVTEVFSGLATTLTTLDVVSVTPSADEDAYILNTRHQIESITSESSLVLAADATAGFGGTLEDVEYRITRDLSLNEQAELLAGYAASLGSRRVVSTWPDVLAVSVNSVATKVPGYFAGAVLAGMTAGLPSQAGFTNLSITGFVGRENSDDLFSDAQLDIIAGGGNLILTQPVPDAALGVRHQLTTDLSTIYFQEYSVTKNVDLIARFFRSVYRPFIGIYNITDGLLDLLKTKGESGLSFLKSQRVQRLGAPIRSGELTRIEESLIQPDSIEIDIDIDVPLPLNNIKLTLLV